MDDLPTSQARALKGEERVQYASGDVIAGKFKIRSLLGEGGMGSVWVAKHISLDVDVAIKLIRHGIASPEASERLLQEARAAARLEHASIVRVFDFGSTEAGDPFIAMELLRGESLGQLIDRRGRLSAQQAVCTLLPVASAVAAAHAKGIVHRDLKPDNVILADNDAGTTVPKVVDFGIAKVRPIGSDYPTLTHAGAILGSPDYMSPEQARGRSDVGEKADVWAMAVMLYECLTGQRPFMADNYNALITSIIEDDPVPITSLAGGDDALWEIVKHGLSKAAADRPTMRELGESLARWAFESGAESDVTGASLAQWMGRPSTRPFDPGPISGRTTASRRREVLTAGDVGAPLTPVPRSGPSSTSGTRAEWSNTPPRSLPAPSGIPSELPPRPRVGRAARVAAVVALALVIAATFAVTRKPATVGTASPPEAPSARSAAQPVPVTPQPRLTASAVATTPPAAEVPASATVAPQEPAHPLTKAPPAAGAHPGKPAVKGAPTLAVPERPNF